MRRLILVGLLVSACAGYGCGGDGGGGSGDGSGGDGSGGDGSGGDGSGGDGSGGDGSGGDGGDGASGDCTLEGRDVLAASPRRPSGLHVVADALVYLWASEDGLSARTIERLGTDGSDPQTLATSTGSRRIESVYAKGSAAYYLERNEDVVPALELFQVPVAGGMAQRIGAGTFEEGTIFAVDDTHVHLWRLTPTTLVIERVAIADGTLTRTASMERKSTPMHMHLSGDTIFFIDSPTGVETDGYDVFSVEKSATDGTPAVVWDVPVQSLCGFPLGGFRATPTEFACGFSGVLAHARADGTEQTLAEAGGVRSNILAEADGENLYLIEQGESSTQPGRLKRLAATGGSPSAIACDVGSVANEVTAGFFPIQPQYEVEVGDTEVFWVEELISDSGVSYTIRAAAK